jgi:hypothetical protein
MTALDRLSQIIPQDQALASKAIAVSMQSITGINSMTLPSLANTTANVKTNFGLPAVNAQTAAVSPATAAYFNNNLAKGTGPNGTLVIEDILGTAAGYVHTEALVSTVATLSTMNTSSVLTCYQTMAATLAGTYTFPDISDPTMYDVIIPAGLPGAGTYGPYTTANLAINAAFGNAGGLLQATNSAISSLVSSYPSQSATLNTNFNNMIAQLVKEKNLQAKANLDFTQLIANSQESIYGLVFGLPSYGQDTQVGGTAQFFESLAVMENLSGQIQVAVLRQGQTNISGTGVGTNNNVPAQGTPPPQAPLSPSQYPYPK